MSGEFRADDRDIVFPGFGQFAVAAEVLDDEVLAKTIDVLNKHLAPWFERFLRDQSIARRYARGESIGDLVDEYGVHYTTVYLALRRFGVEPRYVREEPPSKEDEAFLTKFDELRNYAAVGRHFGVSRQRAHQRIARARRAQEKNE